MKKIILICGLLVSSYSFSANWVYVSSSKTQDKFYIDYSFYKYDKNNNTVDLWFKVEEINKGIYYTEQKTLVKHYCGSNRTKELSSVYYYPSGGIKNTFESNYNTQSSIVFPDTPGEKLINVACATPGKGLDFKEPKIEDFDDYNEYVRANYAYVRITPPDASNTMAIEMNLAPEVKAEDYQNYDGALGFQKYTKDRSDALKKLREKNIQKQYK